MSLSVYRAYGVVYDALKQPRVLPITAMDSTLLQQQPCPALPEAEP